MNWNQQGNQRPQQVNPQFQQQFGQQQTNPQQVANSKLLRKQIERVFPLFLSISIKKEFCVYHFFTGIQPCQSSTTSSATTAATANQSPIRCQSYFQTNFFYLTTNVAQQQYVANQPRRDPRQDTQGSDHVQSQILKFTGVNLMQQLIGQLQQQPTASGTPAIHQIFSYICLYSHFPSSSR